MNDTHEDDGSITPRGRFDRMEAALNRIESKLDSKADASRVENLEISLDSLEKQMTDYITGRVMSPSSVEYLRRFTEMENAVAEFRRTGSMQAAEALQLSKSNETAIDALKLENSNREAVARAIKETADTRYRTLMWMVGIITILNFGVVVVSMFLRPAIQ